MKIVPHSAPVRGRECYVTIDRMGRLCLSTGLRRELGIKLPVKLYVGYDKVNRRIGIAKPDVVRLVNVQPYSFDKRGCAIARRFVKDNGIDNSQARRYYYEGIEHGGENAGWMIFKQDGFSSPDQA